MTFFLLFFFWKHFGFEFYYLFRFSFGFFSFFPLFLSYNSANKSATKTSDTPVSTLTEKSSEEANKSLKIDENADGEEIADDLSEISDEADDILGQQEVNNLIDLRF